MIRLLFWNFSTALLSLRRVASAAVLISLVCFAQQGDAAISWDAGAGTQWWFNPVNWNYNANANNALPPGTAAIGATDAQINIGYGLGAEGVVYDPTNDPNFGSAALLSYPAGNSRDVIGQLYLSRNTPNTNLLTIKGDLTVQPTAGSGGVVVGRSSGTDGVTTTGRIVQTAGRFYVPGVVFDLGGADTSNAGIGSGTYDYRGGTLDIGAVGGAGLRLSAGSSTPNNVTMQPTGASGPARFIVHNPTTGGYVRSFDIAVAAYAGVADTPTIITTIRDPDGVNRGVGTFEFHWENGAVRPVQVGRNLSLNNGFSDTTGGTRSSRLDLVLGENVCVGMGCVPSDVGLFDVDFNQADLAVGAVLGYGDLNGDAIYDNDQVFSSADATVHYREGDTVSATYGNTTFNWTISYTGEILWDDPNSSDVDTITGFLGEGNGTDIVLIGDSSVTTISADFDQDGDTDGSDFMIWQRNAGGPGDFFDGDTNNDGMVDGFDLSVWSGDYAALQAALAAVPEPTSAMLLGVGLFAVAVRRRR